MNQILSWLMEGDRRGDGLANEVAEFVLANPGVLGDLIEGLKEEDDVVRGRTMDVLEKITRHRPEWLRDHLPVLRDMAEVEKRANAGMHIAMILGHLAEFESEAEKNVSVLLDMLGKEKVFIRAWVISSLCIYARLYPESHDRIVESIAPMHNDPSVAMRTRVRYAMGILTDNMAAFPKGWVKAEGLKYLEEG